MSDRIASTIQCPECGKTYRLGHAAPGKKARCRCGCEFEITAEHAPAEDTGRSQRVEFSDDEALAAVERMVRVKQTVLAEVGKV
ncbi:MAG: hypothetical protein ACYS74_12910, partial [Planctomycetota bacterium]